ncbi:MAG: heme-binding protein [Erythrobacter sp.]|jgi:effector-binding domain-containing protein|nr:heme-binding protein [Erythrobacter sp.]
MAWTKRLGIGAGVALGAAAIAGTAYAQYRDGNEEPSYRVVLSDGDFELRDYAPMIVAEIMHEGDRREASSRSFRRLAAYIFAKDRPAGGEKIAMTSPVLQEETSGDRWRMRFVMPSSYTMASLPPPPSDIKLTELPARRLAALRFSGNGSPEDLARMEARLVAKLAAQGLTLRGDPEYAFYDAPMVPGPLRRNEVLLEVEAQ